MFPHSVSTLEIFGLLILTENAKVADFYLLLQVLDKPIPIFAEFLLRDEEAMSSLHMSFVLICAACNSRAEETLLGILDEDERNWDNFLLDFERDVGIVTLGGDVLVEGLRGGELLPECQEEYLH
jgi:hypothetical protein